MRLSGAALRTVLATATAFLVTPAFAQATGLSGNYLAVSGSIQSNFDALYVLDMQTKFLHGFIWHRGRRELEYVGNRQLERDFRNN